MPRELAKRAIAVVESGETKFIPKNWEKTYFEWMRNIEPWCISRQIWWGHQNPGLVRAATGKVFVAQICGAAARPSSKRCSTTSKMRHPYLSQVGMT